MEPVSPEIAAARARAAPRFPLGTTALVVVLTVGVLALVGGYAWRTFETHRLDLEELVGAETRPAERRALERQTAARVEKERGRRWRCSRSAAWVCPCSSASGWPCWDG
jgi:hypothetical protein